MRNFHLTHIAVNLLLIVTLAIQPLAVCMANVVCSAGCSDASLSCQGCGCCEVERAGDRCCCCSGPAEPNQEETLEASCCSSTGVRSICFCACDSQPLSDSAPRRIANENRETLSLGSRSLDEGLRDRRHLLVASEYAVDMPVPLRFSQVILCIWRL